MIQVYTEADVGHDWLQRYRGQQPLFACVLGFTATGLIPGISAAGATPADREYTAIADAEFLYQGPCAHAEHPLPPLGVGVSPVLITRAVITGQKIPVYLFNAGLPHAAKVPHFELGGMPAECLSRGKALPLATVEHLLAQGMSWGQQLALAAPNTYLIISECVVGGTTTALAMLLGLGFSAAGKVNSSHPACNHAQKLAVVQAGLHAWEQSHQQSPYVQPLQLLAAVGDPMQVVVAGMAITASRACGVLLAGGTQMLAVYALIQAITRDRTLRWEPEQVIVGTTRWVAEDPTGDTVGLAQMIGTVPLLATQLSFKRSRYSQLRAYEQGYVKEGVGAGGCAIAAHLYQGWKQPQLLEAIETLVTEYAQIRV
ncbi:MAG: TIGR00303 family protein [Cyanothece sp. SIO1E1]|nr:TIGR00303 family protein [Cyanothece sp. SIO1E1]